MKNFILVIVSIFIWASSVFAEWTPLGPYGGVITCMTVTKDGAYIGTEGGGVFFSKDGGSNWEGKGKGLENTFVESLTSARDGTLYAGTRDGVFKSRDGKVWEVLPSIPKGSAVKNMAFDADGNLLASLWGSGVFICKKDSDCINPRKELSSLFVNTILPRENGDIVLATEGGIFRKPKGEEKWRMDGLLEYLVPAIALDSRGTLYAGTWGGGVHYFEKDDWNFRSIGISSSMVAVLAKGTDGNLYAGTEGGVSMLSPDATTWSQAGLDNVYVKTLGFGDKGEIFAGSYGRGFWTREKGRGWESRNKGIYNSNMISIAVSDKGEVYAGTKQGLYISSKGDNNWIEVPNLYGMKVNALLLLDGGKVYAGTSNGLFMGDVSESGWKRVEGEIGYMPITSLTRQGTFIYAGTDSDGVFRGTRPGKGEWTAVAGGLENPRIRSLITVDDANVYAGTYGGVYALQKGMTKWMNTGLKDDTVVSLTARGGTVYAAVENKGVFSLSNGKWAPVNGTLPNKRILSVFHADKGLYAGGYGWLAYREGEGPWKSIAGELSSVFQTVITDRAGKVYVGTWGSGIWRLD